MELDKKELRPSEDHAIENAIEELKKRHGATEASEAASVTADHMLELARKKEAVKAAAIEEAKSVVAKAAQARKMKMQRLDRRRSPQLKQKP